MAVSFALSQASGYLDVQKTEKLTDCEKFIWYIGCYFTLFREMNSHGNSYVLSTSLRFFNSELHTYSTAHVFSGL